MTIQTALLYTLFLVTILAMFSTAFIREPDGARKSTPYYYGFYFTGLILYIFLGNIPNYNSTLYGVLIDVVFGLFVSSLTIGICIRYKISILEKLTYVLFIIYIGIVLILQPYFNFHIPMNFVLMFLNSQITIVAILKKEYRINNSEYGLILILSIWTLLSLHEMISSEIGDHTSYFFSDYMIYMMILFPTTMSGIAIFLLGSYLLDSNAELEKLATRDSLTGMLNRRAFFERIKLYIRFLGRNNKPAAIIITDIDKFKSINDTYGHGAGDKVIKKFARIIQDSIRESDISARYGGEEFLIFVPDSSISEAKVIAERIRFMTECNSVKYHDEVILFTASFGIANYRLDKESIISVTEADKALYYSKNSGRNRVTVFSDLNSNSNSNSNSNAM